MIHYPSIKLQQPAQSAASLEDDVICLDCGYNLRGLPAEHACPECGASISMSLRQDFLTKAPLAHQKRLMRGAGALWLGVMLSPVLYVFSLPLIALGVLGLTVSEPGRSEPSLDRQFRLIGRLAVLIGTLGLLGFGATMLYSLLTGRLLLYGDGWPFDAALLGSAMLFAFGFVTTLEYLASVALRLQAQDLADACYRLRSRWFRALVASVALTILWLLVQRSPYALASRDYVTPLSMLGAPVAGVGLWLWWRTLSFSADLRRHLLALSRG